MRVVSWNCNMGLHRKLARIMDLGADVLLIQECADESVMAQYLEQGWDYFWTGDNHHKGLGILARRELGAEVLSAEDCSVRYVQVVRVCGIHVIAIWAMGDKQNPAQRYIGQVWKALSSLTGYLAADVIVAGDFNWNAGFVAHAPLCGSFSDVVALLSLYDVKSVYHTLCGKDYGNEDSATFFMARNPDRGYHIDYAFLSQSLMDSLVSFQIGAFDDWADLSDHVPLVVDIDIHTPVGSRNK